MQTIRKILHPTDFSESSSYAFQLACSLARSQGAAVHVVHVAKQPVVAAVEGTDPAAPLRYREEWTEKLLGVRPDDPGIPVDHLLLFGGDPGAEILRAAQRIGADLIVLGTHGRTGLGRLLMGSVAEQVVRRAQCPVVTVKGPPIEGVKPARAG